MYMDTSLALSTESLGRNCEFGLVQRHFDVEPVSLLRWAGTPRLSLIDGLRNRFEGLAEEMTGRADPPDQDPAHQHWWLTCNRYGILFHTDEIVAQKTVNEATAAVRKRLRWLAAKLIDDLKSAEKLFVFSDAEMADPNSVGNLISAVAEVGPAWVWLVGKNKDWAGKTARLDRRMIGSWMDHLTNVGEANSLHIGPWCAAITEAHRIWAIHR